MIFDNGNAAKLLNAADVEEYLRRGWMLKVTYAKISTGGEWLRAAVVLPAMDDPEAVLSGKLPMSEWRSVHSTAAKMLVRKLGKAASSESRYCAAESMIYRLEYFKTRTAEDAADYFGRGSAEAE